MSPTATPRFASPARGLKAGVAAIACCALLAAAPAGQARQTANLVLNVTFFLNGQITFTLPDGSAVGTTSGAPTVIPAGFYTINLTGPAGCATLPHFIMKGPGESIFDNLTEGEVNNFYYNAYLYPSSTYTWRSDSNTNIVYTFQTNNDVIGTAPPPPGSAGLAASTHSTANSSDLVGSGVAKLQGSLVGSISTTGSAALAFKGVAAVHLSAGKYTLTVVDRSAAAGFVLQKGSRTLTITGTRFTGSQTKSVVLTTGRWSLTSTAPGARPTTIVVS